MNIEFDCECGGTVSEFTRTNGSEATLRVQCEDCNAVYAVTITPIDGQVD